MISRDRRVDILKNADKEVTSDGTIVYSLSVNELEFTKESRAVIDLIEQVELILDVTEIINIVFVEGEEERSYLYLKECKTFLEINESLVKTVTKIGEVFVKKVEVEMTSWKVENYGAKETPKVEVAV